MSGPSEKDRELDAYLSGDSPLSRSYRESNQELPPPHVDAQILAEAHRAGAGTRKRPSLSPFTGSWMVPASVTAVVVLAVSVVVLLPQDQPGLERQRDRFEDAMAPADSPATAGKSVPVEAEQAAPAATYAPAPPQELRSAEPASAPTSSNAAEMESATSAVPELQQRSVLQKELEQKAAPAQPGADSGAAPARNRSQVQDEAARPEEGLTGRVKSEAKDDPAAWLTRIEALIEGGDLETARESLAEFRRAYPGLEVPPRISAALE